MKKSLALFLAFVLAATMLPVLAAAEGEDVEVVIEEVDPGLLPDSPFYFLKRFVENVQTWLTFNSGRKTELLTDRVELRLAELEALEEKFDEEDITDRQEEILQKAAEDLQAAAEGLFERLIGDVDDPDELEDLELDERDLAKLGIALDSLGRAIDLIINADSEDSGEQELRLTKMEKFQERIQHLEQVRDNNPDAAEKGLNRAIENAERQQIRWQERLAGEHPDNDGEQNQGEDSQNGQNQSDKANSGNGNAGEDKDNGSSENANKDNGQENGNSEDSDDNGQNKGNKGKGK